MGRNIAGCGSSVSFVYLPSSTTPTTCMRVPSRLLKYLPTAFVAEPKTLRANSRFTTATLGAFLSSCHERVLPANRAVSAASKNLGDIWYMMGEAAAFGGLRSDVSSVKTVVMCQQLTNGGQFVNPTDVT